MNNTTKKDGRIVYACKECIHHDICKQEDDFKKICKSVFDNSMEASDGLNNVKFNVTISCPMFHDMNACFYQGGALR